MYLIFRVKSKPSSMCSYIFGKLIELFIKKGNLLVNANSLVIEKQSFLKIVTNLFINKSPKAVRCGFSADPEDLVLLTAKIHFNDH